MCSPGRWTGNNIFFKGGLVDIMGIYPSSEIPPPPPTLPIFIQRVGGGWYIANNSRKSIHYGGERRRAGRRFIREARDLAGTGEALMTGVTYGGHRALHQPNRSQRSLHTSASPPHPPPPPSVRDVSKQRQIYCKSNRCDRGQRPYIIQTMHSYTLPM